MSTAGPWAYPRMCTLQILATFLSKRCLAARSLKPARSPANSLYLCSPEIALNGVFPLLRSPKQCVDTTRRPPKKERANGKDRLAAPVHVQRRPGRLRVPEGILAMWVQLNDVGLHAYKVPSIPPPPLLLLVGIGLSTFGTDQCPAWLG